MEARKFETSRKRIGILRASSTWKILKWKDGATWGLIHLKCSYYGCFSKNSGTPKSSILRGVSLWTIHFGVPLFLETSIYFRNYLPFVDIYIFNYIHMNELRSALSLCVVWFLYLKDTLCGILLTNMHSLKLTSWESKVPPLCHPPQEMRP